MFNILKNKKFILLLIFVLVGWLGLSGCAAIQKAMEQLAKESELSKQTGKYGNINIGGRVVANVANTSIGGTTTTSGIPGAEITVTLGSETYKAFTDQDGYYNVFVDTLKNVTTIAIEASYYDNSTSSTIKGNKSLAASDL